MFDLEADEWADLWSLVREVQRAASPTTAVDGWNIGVNVGEAGGQTIAHAHVHLIPRSVGDVEDPRGGVRWVIPSHANYWGNA